MHDIATPYILTAKDLKTKQRNYAAWFRHPDQQVKHKQLTDKQIRNAGLQTERIKTGFKLGIKNLKKVGVPYIGK